MQPPRTPYQVLNVAPDAEPEVIDAAYKVLMKKYHPDKLAGGPPLSESKAAEINDAFRILRDPGRRAQHDADEKARRSVMAGADRGFDPARGAPFPAGSETGSAPNRGNRPPPPPPPYMRSLVVVPQRKRGRRILGWSGVLAALLLIGLTIAHTQGAGGFGSTSFAGGLNASAYQANMEAVRFRPRPPVSRERIEEALLEFDRVRTLYGPIGILAYSDACFDAQSRSRELSDLDFCVAFDHAASAFDAASGETFQLPGAPRFTGEQLDSHHVAAAKLAPQDYGRVEDRLGEIKAITYGTIAARAEAAEPVASSSAAPTASTPAAVQRRAPQRYARTERRPVRGGQATREETDFLEREGGIY